MPNLSNYYFSSDAGTTVSSDWSTVSIPSMAQVQQQFEEYQQRQVEQYYYQEQRRAAELEKERQLQDDKENYPLFFLKEGIV